MDIVHGVLFHLLGILLYGVNISVSQDPCLDGNALELDHVIKRSPSYFMDSSPLCDRYITEAWYRAKYHVMATSPPNLAYCGTLYPVWLYDPIPPDGVTQTLTACEVGFTDYCTKTYEIEVKNCTGFLVYKLKALDTCNSAYCFEYDDNCVNKTVSNVSVLYHNFTWKSDGNKQGIIRHDPYINLLCSFTPSDDDTLLYHIDWYVDNDTVIQGQTVDKDSLQDAILSAEDMIKAGKKINSWIHCVVGIKLSKNKLPCISKPSNLFYAGIEILNHTLTVTRKGKETLKIRPTIPFASETLEIANTQHDPSPLNIQLSFPDNTCEGNVAKCSVTIDSFKHEDGHMYENPNNWNKVYSIEVFNTDDENYYLRNHKLVLRLETNGVNGEGPNIFADADFNDVHINVVEDQEAWKGKRCSSYADPHQTTFDGHAYECQASGCVTGRTYIFYRNDHHLQEIQVKHGSCWGSPRCVCAVAVRAGQDVFTIDACNKYPLFNFPICSDNSLKVIKEYDTIYKVVFPTGTFVRIMLYNRGFWFINLEVYPTVADVTRTSGLCGFLDNDRTNDLRRRDGTHDNINSFSYHNPPDQFSLSWQLTFGSSEDLFSNSQAVYDQLSPLSSYFHKLCTCDEGQIRCSYKQYNECKTKIRGKEYHCVLHSNSRKKRELQLFTQIKEDPWEIVKVTRFKRQTYSDIEAFDICNEAFQQSSHFDTCLQVVPNFSNETLVNCINDIIMTGDQNLTQLHLDTALGQCQSYILLNSTFQDENPDVTTLITNLCRNSCSNRGVCSQGNCTCEYGYGGSDCSFDVLSPPTITRLLDDGICDKSEKACDDITLNGYYFLENMGTTCYVTRKELRLNGNDSDVSTASYTVALEERTLSEGYVRLQFGQNDSWITTFYFNMSNDGTRFSTLYTVHVYQSECQTLNNNSGDITFTLQNGYCYIDGQCIQDGTLKNNDTCLQCRPSDDAYNWTDCTTGDTSLSSTTTDSPQSTTTIATVSTTSLDTGTPDTVPRLTKKPPTESKMLSMKLIGLITGVTLVSILIIGIVGYMIKTKITRRKTDQLWKHLDEKTRRPTKQTTVISIGSDDLFYFDSSADRFSRPPSSISDRAISPTNDLTRLFPPRNHQLPPKPIQVWSAK